MATPTSAPTDAAPLERPTDELRQVLCVKREGFDGGDSWEMGRHYRVQRKWLVFDGIARDAIPFMGSFDGSTLNGVTGRPVWRDIPTVSEAEARSSL